MSASPPDPSAWRQPSLREQIACAQAGCCVLTGGQTGVDTLAAQSALRAGLAVHLVFPLGFRQEDGPLTPARRAELSGAILHELASPDFRLRTWTCAYLSDAIILLDPAGGDGCRETIRAATHLGRPLLNLSDSTTDPVDPAGGRGRALLGGGVRCRRLRRYGQPPWPAVGRQRVRGRRPRRSGQPPWPAATRQHAQCRDF